MNTFSQRITFSLLSFLCTALYSTCWAQVSDSAMLAHWSLDGHARDISQNNNHGQLYGAVPAEDRFGKTGRALFFDGKDDYIEIKPSSDVDSVGDFSILVWAKPASFEKQFNHFGNIDRQYLFCGHVKDTATAYPNHIADGISVAIDSNSGAQMGITSVFYYDAQKKVRESIFFREDDLIGHWQCFVLVRRGSEDFTYLNGRLLSSSTSGQVSSSRILNMQHSWFIGGFVGKGTKFLSNQPRRNYLFHGTLDEVALYNRALGSKEIERLYFNSSCQPDLKHDTVTVYDTIPVYDTTRVIVYDSISVTDTLRIDVLVTSSGSPTRTHELKVYPNPAKSLIYMDSGDGYTSISDHELIIESLTGQVLYRSDINAKLLSVDLSSLQGKGLYLLKVLDAKGGVVHTRKILLE